ncbi:MAG TPA: tetratricopeptide repeat protein, partial [Alphaproteobacteria bacterium]|nr:tetratricopeptide repeat protein [Alphaproteobacteria bacterium]
LGLMYMNGRGVPQDNSEAVKWYRKASEQGYARAQYNLGYMYMKGYGVPQDYAEAVRWYRKAANQGYARALHSLAFMYRYGRGLGHDYEEAVRLFRKAALQGFDDSVKWIRHAAEQGHAGAQYSLGLLYQGGRGLVQDYAEALRWFEEAAQQDYTPAILAQARLLATAKEDEIRDGKKAVVLATEVVNARRSVDAMDTLAAAYAEAGRFTAAIQMQLQVLDMLRTQGASTSRVKPYEKRLELYKDRTPYRE